MTKSATKSIEQAWMAVSGLSPSEFAEFLGALDICAGYGTPGDLKARVRARLAQIHAREGSLDRLMRQIHEWSTDPTVDRIARDDVAQVLGLQQDVADNRFRLELDTLIQRPQFLAALTAVIRRADGEYVLVLGAPGSGKSTALNTIDRSTALAKHFDAVVYNCFTGPGDALLGTRASADNFAAFLVRELHRLRPSTFLRQRAEGADIEAMIAEATSRPEAGHRLVIVIDGVDYASRQAQVGVAGLLDRLPSGLPRGVTIVLSAQTAAQVPARFPTIPASRTLNVPPFSVAETRLLLERSGAFTAWKIAREHRKNALAEAVRNRSHGHPLFARYAADWLQARASDSDTPADAMTELPPYGGDIERWYERLPPLGDLYTRDLVVQMAHCPFGLTPAEADSLLEDGQGRYAADAALTKIDFLFVRSGDERRFRHDSLRMYVLGQVSSERPPMQPVLDLLLKLESDPRTVEHAVFVAIQAGRADWAVQTVDYDWISQGLALGARWDLVTDGIRLALKQSLDEQAWESAVKWVLLLGHMTQPARYLLDEAPTRRAWLVAGRFEAILRQVLDGDELLYTPSGALGVAEELRGRGAALQAQRLEPIATATPYDVSDLDGTYSSSEALHIYVRRLALVIDAADCWATIRRLAREAVRRDRIRSQSARTLASSLAANAAFACLHADKYEMVAAWTATANCIKPVLRAILTGWSALLRHGDGAEARLVRSALRPSAPLTLLLQASSIERFRRDALEALRRRRLPTSWASGRGLPYGFGSERADLVRDLLRDSFLTANGNLQPRLSALVDAIAPTPHHGGALLYAVAVKAGLAAGAAAPDKRIVAGTEGVLRALTEADRGRLPRRDRMDSLETAAGFRAILEDLASLAHSAAEREYFAEWIEADFVPTVRKDFLAAHWLIWPVRSEIALPLATSERGARILDELEGHVESDDWVSHKAKELVELSIAAAQLRDLPRSAYLLRRGVRAAFTYGYRKDITIEYFVECIGAVAQNLGERLIDHAALAIACLAILDELTDHHSLGHAAPRLVAAVAVADPVLATHVAIALFRRLGGGFFGESIAFALRLRGLDPFELEHVFHETPRTSLPYWGPPTDDHPMGSRPAPLPQAIADLAGLYRNESDWERCRTLETAMMAAIRDRDSFERVRAQLESMKELPWWLRHELAVAAARAGLASEARALVQESLASPGDEGATSWPHEHATLVRATAFLAPSEALQLVTRLSQRSFDRYANLWGSGFATIVIETLSKGGQHELAAACLDRFATHLRDLIAVYPSSERYWQRALRDWVLDTDGYPIVELG